MGYIVYNTYSMDDKNYSKEGGLYFSLGMGYEFDCGLTFDIAYSLYHTSIETTTSVPYNYKVFDYYEQIYKTITDYTQFNSTIDLCCRKVGINIGYKFNI